VCDSESESGANKDGEGGGQSRERVDSSSSQGVATEVPGASQMSHTRPHQWHQDICHYKRTRYYIFGVKLFNFFMTITTDINLQISRFPCAYLFFIKSKKAGSNFELTQSSRNFAETFGNILPRPWAITLPLKNIS